MISIRYKKVFVFSLKKISFLWSIANFFETSVKGFSRKYKKFIRQVWVVGQIRLHSRVREMFSNFLFALSFCLEIAQVALLSTSLHLYPMLFAILFSVYFKCFCYLWGQGDKGLGIVNLNISR